MTGEAFWIAGGGGMSTEGLYVLQSCKTRCWLVFLRTEGQQWLHIHHCRYCFIEINKIHLAEETFVNRQNVVAKQKKMSNLSQIHTFNKQNKSSARFENLHFSLNLEVQDFKTHLIDTELWVNSETALLLWHCIFVWSVRVGKKEESEKDKGSVSGLCLSCSQPASCSHLAWSDLWLLRSWHTSSITHTRTHPQSHQHASTQGLNHSTGCS